MILHDICTYFMLKFAMTRCSVLLPTFPHHLSTAIYGICIYRRLILIVLWRIYHLYVYMKIYFIKSVINIQGRWDTQTIDKLSLLDSLFPFSKWLEKEVLQSSTCIVMPFDGKPLKKTSSELIASSLMWLTVIIFEVIYVWILSLNL